MSNKLKADVLKAVNWLAPNEAMSADQANESLIDLVTAVIGAAGTTHVQAAVVAITLARHIEELP